MRNNWRKEPVLGFEFSTMEGGLKERGSNGQKSRWIHYCKTVSFSEDNMSTYWRDALFWYRKAALQGDSLALKMLQQAADCSGIRRRAMKGDAQAQYLLAVYYYHAYGTYRDVYMGNCWIKEAARNGSKSALISVKRHSPYSEIGQALEDPDYFALPVYLPEEVLGSDMAKRHGKLRRQLIQETEMGTVWEKYSGIDFDVTYHEAIAGIAEKQYALAWLYDWGQGVKQDIREAFKWFTEAAFNRYAPAQAELGILYQFGISARTTDLEMFDGKKRLYG